MFTVSSIWIALPNGYSEARTARLSVSVSLRLGSDDPDVDDPSGDPVDLASFPAVLDWPAVVNGSSFTVAVDGEPGPIRATIVSPPADTDLWTSLFAPSSPVLLHHVDDYSGRTVSTYPNADAAEALRAGYVKTFGGSPIDLPSRAVLADGLSAFLPSAHPRGESGTADLSPDEALAVDPEATVDVELLRRAHRALAGGLDVDSRRVFRERLRAESAVARRLASLDPFTYIPLVPDAASAITQLVAFHSTAAAVTDGGANGPRPQGPADVHQAFTALQDYPRLLRLLGLVVDLEIPADALLLASGPFDPRRVRVAPSLPVALPGPALYTPFTAYATVGQTFAVAPGVPTLKDPVETVAGMLNLAAPSTYDLVQIDVDGATLQATNALTAAAGVGGLPALRTVGISLTRRGRGESVYSRMLGALASDAELESSRSSMTLFDKDLIRGYRVDIIDLDAATPVWRSLHARRGSYTFPGHPAGPTTIELDDEGFTQPAASEHAGSSGPNPPPVVVHESVALWRGWSLSVRPPGSGVGDSGPTAALTAVDGTAPFNLLTSFAVAAGSLPRLRYGHRYRLRVRAVDIAGNSLDLAEADQALADLSGPGQTPPVLPADGTGFGYARFEPVPAPVVVLRECPAEAESVERQVIRSNADESSAECADRLRAAVLAERPDATAGYLPISDRHIVAPKASLSSIEESGLLDAFLGAGTPHETGYRIALRDGGLDDTAVVDVSTGNAVPIPPTTGIDPRTGQIVTRPSVEPAHLGADPGSVGSGIVHHEAAVRLPYLPDPLSRGAVLFGLPGLARDEGAEVSPDGVLVIGPNPLTASTAITNADPTSLGSVTRIPFGTSWPERSPFLLRLAEPPSDGPTTPRWDPEQRILTAFLPKGEEALVRVASYLTGDDRETLGQWTWLVQGLAAAQPPIELDDAALRLADFGTLWLLTPSRSLRLVHATQAPLAAPDISTIFAVRALDDPGTYLGGTVGIHGPSTAKIDLYAQWSEIVDDPVAGEPFVTHHADHVFEVPVPPPISGDVGFPSNPDTVPIATYDAAADALTLLTPSQPLRRRLGATVTPIAAESPRLNGPGGPPDPDNRPYSSRHEFGDTRHRTIAYHAVATSRYRDYFPAEVTRDPESLIATGDVHQIVVPSSSRPPAPVVLGCYPTQRWQRPDGVFGRRVRRGHGIRVLVGRPWFTSGDDERLAVLIAPPQTYPPDERHQHYVSHWGADPTWRGDPLPPLTRDRLGGPGRVPGEFESHLPELATGFTTASLVQVVPYAVQFDPRGVWITDVEFDTGTAYRPIVRLALARYQDSSVPGAALSQVVLCDQVACLPDRTITIDPVPASPDSYAVTVDGEAYVAGPWPGLPHIPDAAFDIRGVIANPLCVDVSVQSRVPGTTDELGWRPVPADLPAQVSITTAVPADGRTDPEGPLWQGVVSLPPDRVPGQLRIVVTEREHIATDTVTNYSYKQVVEPDPDAPPGRRIVTTSGKYLPGESRVTLAETIVV